MSEALAIVIVIVFLLVLTIACAAAVRGWKYWKMFYLRRFKRVKISDVYPSLKSGDVILFIATTHGLTNSVLTVDIFSHVGVVVERPDRPDQFYISEATLGSEIAPDPTDPSCELFNEPGASMTPLLTRLKHYAGQYCLMSLNKPLGGKQKKEFERTARESCGHPFPGFWSGLAGLLGVRTTSRHCYQHVSNMLDHVGLSPTEGPEFLDSGFLACSRKLSEIAGVPLGRRGDYFYLEPRLILYDIDAGPEPGVSSDA